MPSDGEIPQPPQPPEVEQRVNLSRGQIIGLPIVLLLALLALFGVFGVSADTAVAEGEALAVTVNYSGRTRYMARHDLEIEVSNRSGAPLEGVSVALDRGFVDALAEASFLPSPSDTTGSSYIFELGSVPASGSKIVTGRIAPGKYWSRPATVTVTTAGGESVTVDFETFVYP